MLARRPAEIVLSAEERAELERRAACYTLPHKVVQRAKLALSAGLSNVEIAARLDSAPEEPYSKARRGFWIVDNGSSHRGQRAADRQHAQWPNLVLVCTCRSTPPGSTRPRSSSRSSHARC